MSRDMAIKLGLQPRARFHSLVAVGSDPFFMLTGVIPATSKILRRSGFAFDEIDLFEVNEAFSTRLLSTLLNQLEDTGGRFGLQTMCEGGGMANATIIERLAA